MSNIIKRLVDILICLAAFTFGFPIFLIAAIAVKLSSEGPVFYSQPRVGKDGKHFEFWKFRSMVVNADEILFNDPELYKQLRSGAHKIENDPRITSIGKIIRRTSIDELPQFWNVLKGDMSFVGPRAYRPDEVELYLSDNKPEVFNKLFPQVFAVKPGITGLWQTSGRSKLSFQQRVELDAKYAKEWNLFMDINIILKTPMAVLKGEGAA